MFDFKIYIYTFSYNNIDILPFIVEYWKLYATKVIVYDNESTDGTIQYLQSIPFVEVRTYSTENKFDPTKLADLKNSVWKEVKGTDVDYVQVSDIDEVIYTPNLFDLLKLAKSKNYSLFNFDFYEICSQDLPSQTTKLVHLLDGVSGFKDITVQKNILFDPNLINEINYQLGALSINPDGYGKTFNKNLTLLHLKMLGLKEFINRCHTLRSRMGYLLKQQNLKYGSNRYEYIINFYKIMEKSLSLKPVLKVAPKKLAAKPISPNLSYASSAGIFYNKNGFAESTQSKDLLDLLHSEAAITKKLHKSLASLPTEGIYRQVLKSSYSMLLKPLSGNIGSHISTSLSKQGNAMNNNISLVEGMYNQKSESYNKFLEQSAVKGLPSSKQKKSKKVQLASYGILNNQVIKKLAQKNKIDSINRIVSNILAKESLNNRVVKNSIKQASESINIVRHGKLRSQIYDYTLFNNGITFDWYKNVSHIYLLHSNKRNRYNEEALKKVGILTEKNFSYIYYNTKETFDKLKYYKKAAYINAIFDAYNKGYENIIILTDDLCFYNNKDYYNEVFSKLNNFDIVQLNPKDISEDCIYLSKKAISSIYDMKIDTSKEGWLNLARKMVCNLKLNTTVLKHALCLHTIDYVFPYVDSRDVAWLQIHDKYTGKANNSANRFRTWDNLKYLFRGLQYNLPFINRVFFLVWEKSLVPAWMNQNNVEIITHKDFILKEYLPTFSSSEIETFLWNIPNLSEYFLYGNDDIFSISEMTPLNFFKGGIPKVKMNRFLMGHGDEYFTKLCKRSFEFGLQEFDIKDRPLVRPHHGINCILSSACIHLYDAFKEKMLNTISMFRSDIDLNLYIYSNYLYGLYNFKFENDINCIYIGIDSLNKVLKASKDISHKCCDIICLNDCTEDDITEYAFTINAAFDKILNKKSKYEI